MQLSVIIPTYNRQERLRKVIAALEAQTYPRDDFEVVVVSDGSTDGTNTYLQALQTPLHLTALCRQNSGVAAARNAGVAQACGSTLLFIDDDVVPGPELLERHMARHRRSNEPLVVLGPMLTPADHAMQPWVRWEQTLLMRQYQDMIDGVYAPTARQFYTGNTSLPRAAVVAVGGFDERFRRAEDVELAYRLAAHGLHFIYEPQAQSYHYAERSFTSWLDTPYAYGRNDVVFAREKGQHWLIPTMMREFYARRRSVQLLVRSCVGRPALETFMIQLLAAFIRRNVAAQAACSAIFNLRYYQGAAQELGGRKRFLALLNASDPSLNPVVSRPVES